LRSRLDILAAKDAVVADLNNRPLTQVRFRILDPGARSQINLEFALPLDDVPEINNKPAQLRQRKTRDGDGCTSIVLADRKGLELHQAAKSKSG
jgi:hypothetical protein